jgi:hypothetical protein
MYRLDDAIFGFPQVGGGFRMRTQFVQMPGVIGNNRYRLYDDRAPKLGQFNWQWTEDQLDRFLIDWDDPTKLNYGANWFEIKLPLGTTDTPDQPYDATTFRIYEAHLQTMYDSTLIGNYLWNVSMSLELFLKEGAT